MVWSLALCPADAKQDPVMVYGAEFGVVFLAKGPRTVSIQEGLYHCTVINQLLRGLLDTKICISPTRA